MCHQAIVILSMEVCGETESDYRVLIDGQVKYITIAPGTYDRDTLSMPQASLPALPKTPWNMAYISRDPSTNELKTNLLNRELAGVRQLWHPNSVDCLSSLTRIERLTVRAFEVQVYNASASLSPTTAILKIASFEWQIPQMEQETEAYRLLQAQSDLAPRFLGHVHEHGRVIGLLVEKVEGREASIDDLPLCRDAVQRFHKLGLLHGDVNKYNFLVYKGTVKLIDFEHSRPHLDDSSAMQAELDSLEAQLLENTGRGGGFMPMEDEDLD